MGPKKDKDDGKKKEVLVGGKNLAALTDEQLLEFQEEYHQTLRDTEKENALLEVELNMLRNAWKMTEDKVSELELENVVIRRELDVARESLEPSQWQKTDSDYDKRVMFEEIKTRIHDLDEGPDDVINLGSDDISSLDDPETVYSPKPKDMEERYEAEKKNIKTDRRLMAKKAKFNAKVNELIQIQASLEEAIEDEQSIPKDRSRDLIASASKALQATSKGGLTSKVLHTTSKDALLVTPSSTAAPTTPTSKDGHVPALSLKALEEIALEEGTISTGSVSDKTEHSLLDMPNIVDDALADVQLNRKYQWDPLQKAIRSHNYLRERKWKREDPRYDDSDSCDSKNKIDSDDDHIFDDFNPMVEEDVDDAVHYHQMRKWLEYDYETLVDEMKKKVDQRIKAINYVWTKDVKDVLCAQLEAAEQYDLNLRDHVRRKIEKEVERTKRNEEHLKLLIQGLEEVRVKMIRERYATNMCIAKQQTEELNYLVQESYDRTINELKASTKFNFNLTQMFFMRSTENDISLVHELHSEQKRVQDHVDIMKRQVEDMKKEVAKMKSPLEEQERLAKWMETTIAALQKDMRSKKDQERKNMHLSQAIENIDNETQELKKKNYMINVCLGQLQSTYEEISEFKKNYKDDNAFNRKVRELTKINEGKIVNLRRKLKESHGVDSRIWRQMRKHVMRNVKRCKNKQWHDLLETKAFNELVTQFDIRARRAQMKSYAGIDKLAIPYRKTSANIITTFDEKKKIVFPPDSAEDSRDRKKLF